MFHFLVQISIGLRLETQRSWVRVLALARNFFEHLLKRARLKGPLFHFFSALCDVFRTFVLSKKGFLQLFFDILQQNRFSKNPNCPPFLNFKHFALVEPLSLRFSTDFRRSCLVIRLNKIVK